MHAAPIPFISLSRVFTFCSLEFRISSSVSPFGVPFHISRIRENYYRPFVFSKPTAPPLLRASSSISLERLATGLAYMINEKYSAWSIQIGPFEAF